ncbi:MAG: NAD(P)H-dependent glycerol-3-phosphate dehydrogenase [Tenuifilaceae bacterium]|jgi:glycerol-3-phosphate dehydrogenase (NAD(P)+)|nr:NAD(P)H-dependent glycerol-3-phosphate dehydrogenase [Tenuifilaceae bacterium]
MNSKKTIGIIGSGSWATAITKIIHENFDSVNWYIREPSIIDNIKAHSNNPNYLSSVKFNLNNLFISSDINEVVEKSDIIIFVVPSAFLTTWLEPLTVPLNQKFVVTAIKGIIPNDNITIAEYFNQYHKVPFDNIGVISGPSHAEEVALNRLSYLTVSCKKEESAAEIASYLNSYYIRTILSTDIYGTEYSAVLKNIYAIATGIAHGLGYGDNFLAVLVSNAQLEIKRFLKESYPSQRETSTSAYLGDLLVTCYSQFSRNRLFGTMVGKGYSVKSTMIEMNMVAEGYYSSHCIYEINLRLKIDMPISHAVYNILYEGIAPAVEMKILTDKLL